MTTTTKTQIRGICQCCGRDQAVMASGRMSKHGYTVEAGWFSGVCRGQNHQPMQVNRGEADAICREVAADCDKLEARLAGVKAGTILPTDAPSYSRDARGYTIRQPYETAESWHQESAVRELSWKLAQRAAVGRQFVAQLQALADRYHGQPLRVVPAAEAPAPIVSGEQRVAANGRILTATTVGRNVRAVFVRDGTRFSTLVSTRSWRALPMAPAAQAAA